MNPVYDPSPPDITPELRAVMASAVQNRASAIHIKAGKPPMLRTDGALRDPAKHKTIPAIIAREGSGSHCQTFDQHILVLLRNKLITLDTDKSAASSPSDMVRALRLG